MNSIDFYYVDNELIKILQTAEIKARGFTRVPNMLYKKEQKQKFICGVVLEINGFNYYAPISHYKIQKPNNVLINIKSDKYNQIKGSIRLNYMFPVPEEYLNRICISSISDTKEKDLLNKELKFCKQNQQIIENVALKTYLEIVKGTDEDLKYNSCEFTILENALRSLHPQSSHESSDKVHALV